MSGRFHLSLTKELLVSGGEREPAGIVIGAGIFFLVAAWQFVNLASLVVGVLILTTGLYAVRRIAKRDPKMFKVYRRYLTYRSYYPARSSPAAGEPRDPAQIALPAGLLLGLLACRYVSPVPALVLATVTAATLYFMLRAGNRGT